MRIYIKITKNKELIPYNYQRLLTGCIHKWIGFNNEEHGASSLYSFSFLQNTKSSGNKGLNTTLESYFFFSAHDDGLIKAVLRGITSDPEMFCGVKVKEVQIIEDREFGPEEFFLLASPVFIKRRIEGKDEHILYDDPVSSEFLTSSLMRKLEKANLQSEGVNVSFDQTYQDARAKLVKYNKINNKASVCPIIIKGSSEQIEFAWNVGIGHSTGIGFGALK